MNGSSSAVDLSPETSRFTDFLTTAFAGNKAAVRWSALP
jgi:hypothetical protein